MTVAAAVPIQLDRDHRYEPQLFGVDERKWPRRRGHLYRPHCVCRNVHTGQCLVVYVGVTGPDAGAWFGCTLIDWLDKFQEVAGPAAEADRPRVAGHVSGSPHG